MLGQLSERIKSKGKKSALVILSSVASHAPPAGFTAYCATKIFDSFIAEGLNYELKDSVDVLSYKPAGVNTNMLIDEAKDCTMITPETAANTCFRDLGYCQVTYGSLKHALLTSTFNFFPRSFL